MQCLGLRSSKPVIDMPFIYTWDHQFHKEVINELTKNPRNPINGDLFRIDDDSNDVFKTLFNVNFDSLWEPKFPVKYDFSPLPLSPHSTLWTPLSDARSHRPWVSCASFRCWDVSGTKVHRPRFPVPAENDALIQRALLKVPCEQWSGVGQRSRSVKGMTTAP